MRILVMLLALSSVAGAQTDRPQVLIVGTYHMANPGLDMVNVQADDVLAPTRQAEIAKLVAMIAAFRPTKVALEFTPARDSLMNARYAGFLAGSYNLTRNETEQVGFRVARGGGHPRVFGIDYQMPLDLGGVFQFAMANGHQQFVADAQREIARIGAESQTQMAILTVPEIIAALNRPARDSLQRSFYLRAARVSRDTAYPGAVMAGDWYERNMRMLANIGRVITSPGDRVFVLVGSGHTAFLRDFIRGAGEWDVIDPAAYLR